jgi:uncharacterized membrane protein (GlpM family)
VCVQEWLSPTVLLRQLVSGLVFRTCTYELRTTVTFDGLKKINYRTYVVSVFYNGKHVKCNLTLWRIIISASWPVLTWCYYLIHCCHTFCYSFNYARITDFYYYYLLVCCYYTRVYIPTLVLSKLNLWSRYLKYSLHRNVL